MNKFILNILIYVTGFIVFIVIPVSYIPDNKEKRFIYYTKGDENKSKWIYNILTGSQNIDIAFFGASYILQSVNPLIIESELDDKVKVFNFAMPYNGRDLDYVFIKETLKNKSPKIIVLQLRPYEGRTAHPLFYELAEKEDIYTQPFIPALAPIIGLDLFLQRQLKLITPTALLPIEDIKFTKEYQNSKGYKKIDFTMEVGLLEKNRNIIVSPFLPSSVNRLEYYYGQYYLKKIYDLSLTYNVKIIFLNIPNYKDHRLPNNMDKIMKYGSIMFLPEKLVDNPIYRSDNNHLNSLGASELSKYVGCYLRSILVK